MKTSEFPSLALCKKQRATDYWHARQQLILALISAAS
jgi:hypothetical protein